MTGPPAVILLVDDDVDFVDITQSILEANGYEARCATDLPSARRQVQQERPDLIITDLMMEALDAGFSFAREVKADARLAGVPVILMTSVSRQLGLDFRPRSAEDLSAMGVDAYFDKPAQPNALLAKIAELLHATKKEDDA